VSDANFIQGELSGAQRRVIVIASRFNEFVVSGLVKGAIGSWEKYGGKAADLVVARAPGAFELPVLAKRLARSGKYDAIVALGCVIRGETAHFEYVAGECARGLQNVAVETGVPVVFGVLATETVEQALQRAAPGGSNKGGEAMETALEMADLCGKLDSLNVR